MRPAEDPGRRSGTAPAAPGCGLERGGPAEQGRRGSYSARKRDLIRRLRRVEGQVRGLQRMVDEEQYCVDVLVQIAAVKAALDKVAIALLEEHTRGCVSRAIRSDRGADDAISELMDVIMRFVR
ncbi:MAG: metal-sensitive transcriptional regulator [Limnochordaceae bacterium]|nr:metal-sensitive transcriptional regulator [Limnochordaceae bacterium]